MSDRGRTIPASRRPDADAPGPPTEPACRRGARTPAPTGKGGPHDARFGGTAFEHRGPGPRPDELPERDHLHLPGRGVLRAGAPLRRLLRDRGGPRLPAPVRGLSGEPGRGAGGGAQRLLPVRAGGGADPGAGRARAVAGRGVRGRARVDRGDGRCAGGHVPGAAHAVRDARGRAGPRHPLLRRHHRGRPAARHPGGRGARA